MEHALALLHYAASFVVVLSVVVFIHEFGHFLVARWCGVRVDAFSIGFGRELVGWNDRHGTRWKISLLPLGGYVKMFGDASEASTADVDALERLSATERRHTFHFKPLWQKAAVVAAGPMANFLLTIAIFTYVIFTVGLPSTEPVIGEVMPGSPAMEAGLEPGDRIMSVDGEAVHRFTDIPQKIATNLEQSVVLVVLRDSRERTVSLTPRMTEDEDALGNHVTRPLIGIKSQKMTYENVGLGAAVMESVQRTYELCASTLRVLGQMVMGERSAAELKGPVGIAQLSGQATERGFSTTLWLIAMLSANLGLINLLPVPLLDGGHLAYYSAEALRGRPLAEKVQRAGYRLGYALIIMLMAFTLWNDMRGLLG